MKPIFTVHAGEYLVASYVEKHFKKLGVWVPSKDTGVDLLLTNPQNAKMVGLQVKFSKDFLSQMSPSYQKDLQACGWWTLNQKKIKKSLADFWVFVLYSFDNRQTQYLVLEPKTLLSTLKSVHGNQKTFNMYAWVTTKQLCWETRGLKKTDQQMVTAGKYSSPQRDLTQYLNDWPSVVKRLA